MLLETFFDMLELHRDDKFVSLRFLRPFKVISTSMPDGGLASHLDLVFNHQCSEPAAHTIAHHSKVFFNPDGYRAALLADHGLEKAAAAGLGTAANMNNMCVAQESHLDLSIVAIVTGGVEGNAARAGDPASFYEQGGTFHRRGDIGPEQPGTINIMLACNTPLTDGALVRAVMTATEAKSVVLQELSVPSRQSPVDRDGHGHRPDRGHGADGWRIPDRLGRTSQRARRVDRARRDSRAQGNPRLAKWLDAQPSVLVRPAA